MEFPSESCHQLTVDAGGIIFLQGQAADAVYVILKGHAEVVVSDGAGKMVPVSRMKPGELFGEIALLREDGKRTATVVAADPCTLLQIDRDVFDSRIAHADPLLRFVLEHVTRRLADLTNKVISDRDAD